MRTMRNAAAAAVLLALAPAAGEAKPTSFSTVPANIADAPVQQWRDVARMDKGDAYRWRIRFPGGFMWISELHAGRYWPAWKYESESHVLQLFENGGHSGFRRIEATRSHGSKWGYIAMSNKDGRTCVVGIVLDNDSHSHDGEMGGTLRGYAVDCGPGAESRFGEWKTWFRSFRRVPPGRNAALDRSSKRTGPAFADAAKWKRIGPSEIVINLADLGRVPDARFEQRTTNSGWLNQRVVFLQRKGGIFIERTPDIFTHGWSMQYDSQEQFIRETKKVFRRHGKRGTTIHFDKIERIREHGGRSGHVAAVEATPEGKPRGTGRSCVVAGLAFLGEGKKNPAADERFDTRVMLRDCSGGGSLERAADWVRGIKIVPKGYNRGLGG